MDESEQALCSSLDELLEVYGDTVYRIALQNMGNVYDAQDVSQDVFLRIMKKRPQFTSKEHEKAWILRVTINVCKDCWKYQKLRTTVELQENLAGINVKADFGLLYEVMKLPVKYRNVLYLFYYEELSVSMIAEILQKKEATILTWLHRARKQLKKRLEEGELL
ncbi:sigma-70 family RNA polymerase sigma factor [[Clostridium] innocuum]|nr:sigma-70 family RNA polymerase sigma factor [[Clostridium] innocuum]